MSEPKYEPDKFIVINRGHLDKLTGCMQDDLEYMLAQIENKNSYIVCNQNEPYAQKVLDVILEGEREKSKTKEQKEKEYQERKDDEFFDNNYA